MFSNRSQEKFYSNLIEPPHSSTFSKICQLLFWYKEKSHKNITLILVHLFQTLDTSIVHQKLKWDHNRRRSDVFGDARYWFCSNLIRYALIEPLLSKSNQICPNFASILPKSNPVCLILINFNNNMFVRGFGYRLGMRHCGCISNEMLSYSTEWNIIGSESLVFLLIQSEKELKYIFTVWYEIANIFLVVIFSMLFFK